MPVPKKKTSTSRRNTRRAHDFLTAKNPIICPNCGESTLRHRACASCGQYRGKQIVNVSNDM